MRIAIWMCIRSGETEWSVEQFFDFSNSLFVDQEHDDMIAGLDHDIIVGNDHVVAPDDGTDVGAGRKVDVFDPSSDDT